MCFSALPSMARKKSCNIFCYLVDLQVRISYTSNKNILLEVNMSIVEVTSLSTRGQVVIPNNIRENLKLKPGTKMIIIQEGDNILLKPIKVPGQNQFRKIIAIGDRIREELELKESDIDIAIKKVRQKDANRN